MDTLAVTLTLAVGLICLFLFKNLFDYRKQAPGPWGIPFLGYLPFIFLRNPLQVFNTFKHKYGKIFSLKLGKFGVVVINDYKTILEVFNKDAFNGKPAFDIQMFRNHGSKRGLLFSEGTVWSEQRRHVVRNLRKFGFGKMATMDSLLSYEADSIIQFFDQNIGKPMTLQTALQASVLNSLWYFCTSSRFKRDDPAFDLCIQSFTETLTKLHLTGVGFYFPWILKQSFVGFWDKFIQTRDRVHNIINGLIEEHKRTYDPNVTRDLLDTLITECNKTTDPNSSFYGKEGELNMLIDLKDLFLAGAETTSTTLKWLLLYMIAFPDVQENVQEEIEKVIGERQISLEDKASLLYTEATIYETLRYSSMVPLSIFHNTLEDTSLGGYHIPKDTVILANFHDAHNDATYWKDPEVFRPERFIDPVNRKIIKHEAFMPFSTGKRLCPGIELAKDTLFIFFTTLMQRYTFEKDPKTPAPLDLSPLTPSLVMSPKPFSLITTRKTPTIK